MADKGIVRQPARSTLPTPIETGHMPPCLMKMGNGFQIFLENIAPTRQEQHRPARSTAGGRPVETTNSPAVRGGPIAGLAVLRIRSEEQTSALQSPMRTSYAVFCWKKKETQMT